MLLEHLHPLAAIANIGDIFSNSKNIFFISRLQVLVFIRPSDKW